MKIRLYPPFDALGADIVELHFEREMTLHEFCEFLVSHIPRLSDFLPQKDGKSADLLYNVFFVTSRENPARILQPSHVVRDEDFLEMMPPFDGG